MPYNKKQIKSKEKAFDVVGGRVYSVSIKRRYKRVCKLHLIDSLL